jgi:hypothetical protein
MIYYKKYHYIYIMIFFGFDIIGIVLLIYGFKNLFSLKNNNIIEETVQYPPLYSSDIQDNLVQHDDTQQNDIIQQDDIQHNASQHNNVRHIAQSPPPQYSNNIREEEIHPRDNIVIKNNKAPPTYIK